jgi:hypothetical protein
MDVKTVVQFQLNGSFELLAELLGDMDDDEWQARPFKGANLIGFTVWHCARTVDWALNCALRGSPELADLDEWRDVKVEEAAFGAGASRAASDRVARDVSRVRVLEYTSMLRAGAISWLAALPTEELSAAIDLKAAHAMKPAYMAPAVWAEIEDLDGIPKWQFLARPCASHIRVHYGEVASQLESVRATTAV